MTQNQVSYFRYLEEKRSHLANEDLQRQSQAEQWRHNVASEVETNRHNVTTEGESQRHNAVSESAELFRNVESQRHNIAVESETATHNRQTEAQAASDLREQSRHNRSIESIESSRVSEMVRHNYAQEIETNRSNVAKERLSEQTNLINMARTLEEVVRDQETARHNRESEYEASRSNQAREAEQYRHNVATEGESHRHNVETELRDAVNTSRSLGKLYSNYEQTWGGDSTLVTPSVPTTQLVFPTAYLEGALLGLPG